MLKSNSKSKQTNMTKGYTHRPILSQRAKEMLTIALLEVKNDKHRKQDNQELILENQMLRRSAEMYRRLYYDSHP